MHYKNNILNNLLNGINNFKIKRMLKLSRKISSNLFVVLPLCCAVLLASCNKDAIINNSPSTVKGSDIVIKYDGEDLFKGILLFDGQYAESIPILNKFKIENLTNNQTFINQIHNLNNKIISDIKKSYPNYFIEFKEEIKSRDPIIINAAIYDGTSKIYEIVKGEEYKSKLSSGLKDSFNNIDIKDENDPDAVVEGLKDYINQHVNQKDRGFVIVAVVAIIAAAAVYAVAALVQGVVVQSAVWVANGVNSDTKSKSNLLQEKIIGAIMSTEVY